MTTHGISVGIECVGTHVFLVFKAIGTLTHDDYQLMTPLLDAALQAVEHSDVRVFVDASEFEGWELRAAWDDFKLGLKYGRTFHKIALYGHQPWQAFMAKIGRWFTSGEVKYFEDRDKALNWLQSD